VPPGAPAARGEPPRGALSAPHNARQHACDDLRPPAGHRPFGRNEHAQGTVWLPPGLPVGRRRGREPVRGRLGRGRQGRERRRHQRVRRRHRGGQEGERRDHRGVRARRPRRRPRAHLPQALGHRLLPHLQGGPEAPGRHGAQDVPHLHRLGAHLPQRRRRRAQRGGPGLLRPPLRRDSRQRHGAARHHLALRDAHRAHAQLHRLVLARGHRLLRALLPGGVRSLREQGEVLGRCEPGELRGARELQPPGRGGR